MIAEIEKWPWWMFWPLLGLGLLAGCIVLDWARGHGVKRQFRRPTDEDRKRAAALRRKLLGGILNRTKGKREP